jgi:hypothetical protein
MKGTLSSHVNYYFGGASQVLFFFGDVSIKMAHCKNKLELGKQPIW